MNREELKTRADYVLSAAERGDFAGANADIIRDLLAALDKCEEEISRQERLRFDEVSGAAKQLNDYAALMRMALEALKDTAPTAVALTILHPATQGGILTERIAERASTAISKLTEALNV